MLIGMDDFVVYCADIGSVRTSKFGWARATRKDSEAVTGTDIALLVAALSDDLTRGAPVALGLESPLFMPVTTAEALLGAARVGEGNRPWSAGAGSGVLATGVVQAAWILARLQEDHPQLAVSLSWETFESSGGLLLWEAFVSGTGKANSEGNPHVADALIGAEAFRAAAIAGDPQSCVSAERPLSLIGAAILWSELSDDIGLLHQPPLVIRGEPATS